MNKEKTPTGECLKGPLSTWANTNLRKRPVAPDTIYRQPYVLSTDGNFLNIAPQDQAPWGTHRLPIQRSLRARAGRVVSRAHRVSDSPCLQVVPPGSACIAVQAPEAHCWYFEPMQLNMPSEVQAPDLPPEEDEPPSEPVELPEPEPEPPPVGERVADADAEVSAADVDAGAEAEEEEGSVAAGSDAAAELEPSGFELEVGFGVTGLT